MGKIACLKDVLSDVSKILKIIKDELQRDKTEIRGRTPHRDSGWRDGDVDIESSYPNDDVVIMISSRGYVKRVALDEYRARVAAARE